MFLFSFCLSFAERANKWCKAPIHAWIHRNPGPAVAHYVIGAPTTVFPSCCYSCVFCVCPTPCHPPVKLRSCSAARSASGKGHSSRRACTHSRRTKIQQRALQPTDARGKATDNKMSVLGAHQHRKKQSINSQLIIPTGGGGTTLIACTQENQPIGQACATSSAARCKTGD